MRLSSRERWLLVVLTIAVLFGSAGASPAFEHCVGQYDQGQTSDAAKKEPGGLLVVLHAAPGCVVQTLNEYNGATLALATIVLVLVTGGLAYYTAKLWGATVMMAGQAKDEAFAQGKRTDAAIHQAARSADAMDAQVRKTDEIARQELRAYLGIVEMKLARHQNTGHVYYTIKLRNYGRTPAFSVSASMTRKILRFPLPDDFQMVEDRDHDNYRSYTTLPPTAEVTVTSSRRDPTLPDDQYRAAIDGNDGTPGATQVYCFGTIRYRDVFGQDHWAHYCKSFGGNYYRENDGKPTTSNVYNDSSDDPQPGAGA